MPGAVPVAPSGRQHVLAILERLIAEAEKDARQACALERLARGEDAAHAREALAAARDRLELLRQSRRCLVTGEPPEEAGEHGWWPGLPEARPLRGADHAGAGGGTHRPAVAFSAS